MIPPDDEDAIEITDDEEDDLTPMQAVKNLVAEKPNCKPTLDTAEDISSCARQ